MSVSTTPLPPIVRPLLLLPLLPPLLLLLVGRELGMEDGALETEGLRDGKADGVRLGADDGKADGVRLGADDGKADGVRLGADDGVRLGADETEGLRDGKADGVRLGADDGKADGVRLGADDGITLGADDGKTDGVRLGADETEGARDGKVLGSKDGAALFLLFLPLLLFVCRRRISLLRAVVPLFNRTTSVKTSENFLKVMVKISVDRKSERLARLMIVNTTR